MAKKGQPVQLQTEVNNDEEWEKLLQKDGLIIVDVYSDWCGSCQGMAANLKKLKLEFGGDLLQLAMAKSDNISQLERFRNKSEPTWMFISKGKMVNLMFGADAPKLTRLIIEELKQEQLSISGEKERESVLEITDLAPEEQVRYEAAEIIAKAAKEKEEAKRLKELHDRRTAECNNIITNLPGFGTILILPNAKDMYHEALSDLILEAGLSIQQTEKVNITEEDLAELFYFCENEEEFNPESIQDILNDTSIVLLIKTPVSSEVEDIDEAILSVVYGIDKKPPGSPESIYEVLFQTMENEEINETFHLIGKITSEMLEELLYFSDSKFSKKSIDDVTNNKVSLAILMKRSSENLPGDIDEVILQMVYGNSRNPPGDERSPSQRLMKVQDENEQEALIGIWAPPNQFAKAVALKLLFPNLSASHRFPDTEPTPLYVAVGYDAFKTRDFMEISAQYPGQVMAYGFFTSDIPPEAQLIAKTVEQFEARSTATTYEEKLVVQLAKTNPDCFMAFTELGPSYMSSDVEAGEIDCKYFFPPGYNVREEEVTEVKKKYKKKGKSKPTAVSNQEETTSVATSDLNKEQSEIDHEEVTEPESDEEKLPEATSEEIDDKLLGADKATSPIEDQI